MKETEEYIKIFKELEKRKFGYNQKVVLTTEAFSTPIRDLKDIEELPKEELEKFKRKE